VLPETESMKRAQFMTTSTNHAAEQIYAPELMVQTWFNTDRPLRLSDLRGRVVVLAAFQVMCPKSIAGGVPQAQRIYQTFQPADVAVIGLHATFGPVDDLRIGAEIGALTQESAAAAVIPSSRQGESHSNAGALGNGLGTAHNRPVTPLR